MWTVIEEENRRNQVGEQEDEEEIEDINGNSELILICIHRQCLN